MVFLKPWVLFAAPFVDAVDSCTMMMKLWNIKSTRIRIDPNHPPYIQFSKSTDWRTSKVFIGRTEGLKTRQGHFPTTELFTFPSSQYDYDRDPTEIKDASSFFTFTLKNHGALGNPREKLDFQQPDIAVYDLDLREGEAKRVGNGEWEITILKQCGDNAITKCRIWEDNTRRSADPRWRNQREENTLNVNLKASDSISFHQIFEDFGNLPMEHSYVRIMTTEKRLFRGNPNHDDVQRPCFFTLGVAPSNGFNFGESLDGITPAGTGTTLTAPDAVLTNMEEKWMNEAYSSGVSPESYFPTFSRRVFNEYDFHLIVKSIGFSSYGPNNRRRGRGHYFLDFGAQTHGVVRSKPLTANGVRYLRALLGQSMSVQNRHSWLAFKLNLYDPEYRTGELWLGNRGWKPLPLSPGPGQSSTSSWDDGSKAANMIYNFDHDLFKNQQQEGLYVEQGRIEKQQQQQQGIPPRKKETYWPQINYSPARKRLWKFLIKNKQ